MNGKILLDRKEAANLLSISLRTLDTLLAQGELKTCRIGRRRLIPRQELEQFARRDHRVQPNGPKRTSDLANHENQ